MDFQECTINDIINSERHMELVNGKVVFEDKTTVMHNTAVSEIATSLKNFIASKLGTDRVFTENVALYVNEMCGDSKNFFLPDIMTVSASSGIKEDGVHTVPTFVVEVASETTKVNDYCGKLEIYRKIGVNEYWIVDLQRSLVFVYCRSDNYVPQVLFNPKEVDVLSYQGLIINTAFLYNE